MIVSVPRVSTCSEKCSAGITGAVVPTGSNA